MHNLNAEIMVLETIEQAIRSIFEAQAEMLPTVPPGAEATYKNQIIGSDAAIGTICVAISERFEVPFATVLERFGIPEERRPYFIEIRRRTKAARDA